MQKDLKSCVCETLRWYLGRNDIERDADRLASSVPLALIGGEHDDLEGFADRLAPERPVLDLGVGTPTVQQVRSLFGEHPDTIVLAHRAERVIGALGLMVQPWYIAVSPLSARPNDAVRLLRIAIAQLGVQAPLELLGPDILASVAEYEWPRGLREIREASRRFGAYLEEGGNLTAAARLLDVSRQAVTKYLNRRVAL